VNPTSGVVRLVLRLESLIVLALAIWTYRECSPYGWGFFLATALLPDVSLAGYLAGPRVGAVIYNSAHTYIAPMAVGCLSAWATHTTPTAIALVWIAHIAMDRVLGYGLKYGTTFNHTHLGTIGRGE
jgi:hypothetical protein